MIIKSLSVQNFRNHSRTNINLSPGCNILAGSNAAGKTNLLEAIYLTCVGRSSRTNKDRDMIKFGETETRVTTRAQKKFGECTVEITISNTAKKMVKINDIPIQKMGELMGQVNCVFFSPDELKLIKEAPADRRRFMDIDISQTDKTYFYALLRYNKILQQRNALLKNKSEDIKTGLEIWDAQLAEVGALIIQRRLKFITQLKTGVTEIHNFLTDNKEAIELSYLTVSDNGTEQPLNESSPIKQQLLDMLIQSRSKDMRLCTTTVGPHRDDLRITINDKDVRHFASQGQQRTVALSLKIAELNLFKSITGELPILLLDDVFSELDDKRQRKLLQAISACQCILTTAKMPKNSAHKVFEVSNGTIYGISK